MQPIGTAQQIGKLERYLAAQSAAAGDLVSRLVEKVNELETRLAALEGRDDG